MLSDRKLEKTARDHGVLGVVDNAYVQAKRAGKALAKKPAKKPAYEEIYRNKSPMLAETERRIL
jgi:hypothetical protein